MTITLILSRIRRWYHTHEAMRRLRELDDPALKDIGINRGEIFAAASGREPTTRNSPSQFEEI